MKAISILLVAGALAAKAVEPAWVPLQLSAGPGEWAVFQPETAVRGVRLGLFADNIRVDGLDLCLIGGQTRDGASGLQLGTLGAACLDGAFHGVQLSALRCGAMEVTGLQAAPLVKVEGELCGGQAGLICIAEQVRGFQFGLLGCEACEATGLQLGFAANANDLCGAAISFASGFWGSDPGGGCTRGLRAFFVGEVGEVDGVLVMGGGRADRVRGLSLAFMNDSRDLAGLQAGLWCRAGTVHGVQLGVLNWADHLNGLQIGLLNISRDGGLPASPGLNWHW